MFAGCTAGISPDRLAESTIDIKLSFTSITNLVITRVLTGLLWASRRKKGPMEREQEKLAPAFLRQQHETATSMLKTINDFVLYYLGSKFSDVEFLVVYPPKRDSSKKRMLPALIEEENWRVSIRMRKFNVLSKPVMIS